MRILIIANSQKDWPFRIPDADVVDAWSYLTQPQFSELRGVKVFNLCRSYKYQTVGYYVSLLAEARGHKPLPSITTLQDLRSQAMMRSVSEELEDLIQHSLGPIQSERFTLSIYFGRNLAKRYERLSLHLFNLFQSPLLRVQFKKLQKMADPQRGHDRRQRRPRGALALRRRSRPAVLRGSPRPAEKTGPHAVRHGDPP